MTFAVFWALDAILELTRIEQNADDPQVIRAAASRIEYALRRYPRDMGESRGKSYREWYEDHLGVFYKIDEAELRVEILSVGPARRR